MSSPSGNRFTSISADVCSELRSIHRISEALNIRLQLRMYLEPRSFGRADCLLGLAPAARHRVQGGEIVVRFSEAAIRCDCRCPLALRLVELTIPEVRAAERQRDERWWLE